MDTVDPLRFLLAIFVVLGLLAGFAYVLKKFGKNGKLFSGIAANARVQIVETTYIDAKRKLVLIAHDDKEHLLLISPESTLVIESNVKNGTSSQ